MKRVLVVAILLAACSGANQTVENPPAEVSTADRATATDGPVDTGSEDVGPVGINTIRIGTETWTRTLPMLTGQCFLEPGGEGFGDSGVVWGTLNGNDAINFSVTLASDGSVEAEVKHDEANIAFVNWVSGERAAGTQLMIDLDFDEQTISGSGTFQDVRGGQPMTEGSFLFQCTG